jgi:cysteine desulfurase
MDAMPWYLDHAATTPVSPEVAELVVRLMTVNYGNAGSRTHAFGLEALREVRSARERVAAVASCLPQDVVFNSGATESSNAAILGLAETGRASGRRHIVTTSIEHKAVLEPVARLEKDGFEVTYVAPDRSGQVSSADVAAAIRPDTILVSVMHANNETGALQPIDEIAALLGDDGPFFHVDAAQTFGKVDGGYRNPRVDLVSVSGHKLFAPMGVGCLIVRSGRRRPPLIPQTIGGGQERGLRAGTVPVPLVAGFGLAAETAWKARSERRHACERIRGDAIAAFQPLRPVVRLPHGGLPHILSISFPGIDSEALMVVLKDVAAVSNGSACTSTHYGPSHVLSAMDLSEEEKEGTIRISWSHADLDVPWNGIAARISTMTD